MGERTFTETDVEAWEVRDRHGEVESSWLPKSLATARTRALDEDKKWPQHAPHRVCAVVPWEGVARDSEPVSSRLTDEEDK